ncbi:class I SAM-dependent methyltransferase [Methylocystis sp. H62]|uniref:class I SAM-dependent methyltransferase n=1 Tax=Methylocystis sp. H62 TaxID=2785789 RepID=UPI0018C31233|nr:class I SAM-dependent methyltransferase [Methylocystis sp. H62]MBG0792004.1 class I SAM-dependent methyltransferase [Methylocystis sp. H62]
MKRADVIQELIGLIGAKSYLEIGVNRGETFHAVQCGRKVAVDPNFLFDVQQAEQRNKNAVYQQTTSDRFFEKSPKGETFDVIFLDGLHTYDQTLRDLLNAVTKVNAEGIIIIDDVLPSSYAASLPDLTLAERVKAITGEKDMSWMGDVYRLVYFIESFLQLYSYATVAENHGQLVMWRAGRNADDVGKMTSLEVAQAEFYKIVTYRDPLILQPFATILSRIKEDRSRT